MKRAILFVFPHPDDEAFPTGGTLARYGAAPDVDTHLYTMTRGESSRNASTLGLQPEELARLRAEEVKRSCEILNVASFRQGSYPDKNMQDLDPRIIENDIRDLILTIQPQVVITYDVQGGSGHADHIVVHAAVKRVFLELKEQHAFLKRLAFVAMPEDLVTSFPRKVFSTPRNRIDAEIDVRAWKETELKAIMAHQTMRRDFEEHNYDNWMLWEKEYYSFYQERHSPPLGDLFEGL